MKVVSYCLDCLNRFVKFVSKNGYIMIALTSNNFCLAAWRAFTLIVSNAGRFMVAQTLGAIFNFLGKLFITLLTLATCIGFMFIPAVNNNISSLLFPSIMVCIIGFMAGAAAPGAPTAPVLSEIPESDLTTDGIPSIGQ